MKKYLPLLFVLFFASVYGQTYTSTTVVNNLYYPVAFDFAPDGRYFITLKGDDGSPNTNAKVVVYNPAGALIGNFYDLSDSTVSNFERGVLGIALDPAFSTNHYVYVYYNHSKNGSQALRVVRFTESNNQGTMPVVLLHLPVGNIPGNHVGGNIHFRPSEPDKLYVSIGELGTPANSQLKTNPFGKFLRINSDGTIPSDNPFYDDGNPATGNDDRIWSYGHRNPFDFTFSAVSDTMYSSENGASAWDEVNIITKGANYGWQQCEGNYVYGSSTNLCNNAYPSHTGPISVWASPLPAVTGILYYTGSVMPEFNNHLLVADNDNGRIYDLTLGNAPFYDTVISRTLWQDLPGGLTTLKQGSEGCIYAMKGGYTTTGNITRICPQGLAVKKEGSISLHVDLFPNPVKEKVTLQVSLSEASPLTVTIVNVLGKTVKKLEYADQAATYTIVVDSEELGAGLYFVTVSTPSSQAVGGNITRKLIVE